MPTFFLVLRFNSFTPAQHHYFCNFIHMWTILAHKLTCRAKPWIFYISCHLNKLFPYGVMFYKHSSRFPLSLSDNRTCLQALAHSYGRRVTANKLTLYFIGLTSRQTLSRCAVLAVSLTPVCLNISSAAYTPVSLTELLLSLHGVTLALLNESLDQSSHWRGQD